MVFLSPRVTVDADALVVGAERVPFAHMTDAWVDGAFLMVATPAGTRTTRVRRGEAMALLGAVLDGIERVHPRTPYRSSDNPAGRPEPGERRKRRRRGVGPPSAWSSMDLMIGRTLR